MKLDAYILYHICFPMSIGNGKIALIPNVQGKIFPSVILIEDFVFLKPLAILVAFCYNKSRALLFVERKARQP